MGRKRWRASPRPHDSTGTRSTIILVRALAAPVAMLALFLGVTHLSAQSLVDVPPLAGAPAAEDAIVFGDMAVSGFAGTKLQTERLLTGVDPVTKTVIDPDGATLEVLNGTVLGTLSGQKLLAPTRRSFKARDVGHVFALAFDNGPATGTPAPSLFAGATSAFGLHIVGPDKDNDGKPDRLDKGAPGAAFMEGQFGALPGGSPGSIWKIDRKTGAVALFADVGTDGVTNSGPGLGGLAVDPETRTLYVSDLDTGLIRFFSIADGTPKGQLDYGVTVRPVRNDRPILRDDGKRLDITSPEFVPANPDTWGYTQKERRIDALTVHDGRLYFAVGEGPEIWSVGIKADGGFEPDVRFEIAIEDEPRSPVTGITFDNSGQMIVAQRGEIENPANFESFTKPGAARVLRFAPESPDLPATEGLWKLPPEEYGVGSANDSRASAGGVAIQYAVNADGTLDTTKCGGTLVASADTLGPQKNVQGVQLSAASTVRPANVPPADSAIIAWRPGQSAAESRGYVGGVAVLHSCTGDPGVGFPELAAGGGEGFPGLAGGDGGPTDGGLAGGGLTDGGLGGGGVVTDPPIVDPVVVDPGGGGKIQVGDLVIEKTGVSETCNETDPCTFDIKVTNTGTAPKGSITIKDVFVGDAPLTARISGTPNAPWTCAAEAPGVSCTHPGPLQPNAPETLTLSFIPGPLGAATEVKNCVATAPPPAPAPQQQGEAPPPPDEGETVNGLNVVTKSLSPSCDVNVPCTLQVTAKNVSAAPMTGGRAIFILNSAVDSAGQTERVGMINVLGSGPPGYTCTEGAALDGQAFCEIPQFTLAPNAAITATFIVKAGGRATGAPFDSFEFLGGFQIGVRDTPGFGESAHIGSVPKTGAAAPAAPKQIAPGKKSEVPSVLRSLVQFARFKPLSPGRNQSLWTLAGGTGGSIGGVSPTRCRVWENPNRGFVVRQSDNITVSFFDMKYVDGRASGKASYIRNTSENERATVTGTVSGTMTPEGNFRLTVEYNDGQRGVYAGKVDEVGNLTGTVSSGGVKSRTMTGERKWWRCASNDFCAQYADQAVAEASAAQSMKCVGEPAERWTTDRKAHLDWCMTGPLNDPAIGIERDARNGEFTQCLERVKKQAEDCTELGKEGVTKGQEFKDRGCGEPDPILSTDLPTQYTAVCVPIFDGKRDGLDPQYVAGIRQSRQSRLDACIARLAAGGGAPGGSAPGGGAGGEAPAPAPPPVPPAGPGQAPAPAETSPPLQACAVIPVEPKEVTGDPVPQGNGLTLLKETVTNDCSGPTGCEFKITLKNEGATPVSGITLVDTPTGDGDFAVVSDALAVSPGAPWVCQKGFPKKCTREGALAAGATDTFNFGMMLSGPNQTATAMRNCVVVEPAAGAPAPTPACADMKVKPPPGSLTISKAPANGVTSCVDNTDCRFVITLTNNSPAPRDGEVKIIETVSDGEGALFGSAEISTPMPAPWKCVKTGQTFECTHPGPLPPGSISPSIGVKLGPGTAAKAVKNCVQIQGQAGAPACATVPIGPPPPPPPPPVVIDPIGPSPKVLSPPNIAVTMPPPEQKICAIRGNIAPGGLPKGNCIFVAQFTNKGDQTFEGTLAYDVTTNRHTATSSRHRTLNCITPGSTPATIGNPQTSQCELSGNTRLVKDGALSVVIDIEPGEGWVKDNVVEVCTKFSYRSKSIPPDPGMITDDDRACQTIKLDPFAVRVSKTGDQQCPPGSDCTFKLTLFNPGPIDHNDPVTITDSLTGLSSAQIVSITPPLPCATQPTQIPFTCTSPGPVRLDLDAPPGSEFGPREFVMVVKLPNDATAEQFSNCATVADDKASSGPSCATVATKPSTPAGACTGGMVMTARGCACPMPTKFDGKSCVGAGGINTTSQPEAPPAPPPPAVPPPAVTPAPVRCSGGMFLIENTCACPPLTQWNGRECSKGFGGSNTSRGDDDPPTTTRSCPANLPVGTFPNCCPQNSRFSNNACQCLSGFEAQRGNCVPVRQTSPPPPPTTSPPPKQCPPNSRLRNGVCECAQGFEPGRRGVCQRVRQDPPQPPKPQSCPADKPVGKFPNCCPANSRFTGNQCQCLPGFESRRRACRPIQQPPPPPKARTCPADKPVGTFPNCCPQNSQLVGNRCECLTGFVNRRGLCRPAPTQPPPQKPTQPQPQPQPRDCGPGYRPLDKPNKYGAFCELIPKPGPAPRACPNPAVGTLPNCTCPGGFRWNGSRCVGATPPPPPLKCRDPRVLSKDKTKCVCASGFREKNGVCELIGPS